MSGKGDTRRPEAVKGSYEENYIRIFGRVKELEVEVRELAEDFKQFTAEVKEEEPPKRTDK